MQHEDGYCDRCGCEITEAWLNIDGEATCRECAIAVAAPATRVASKPEARDDGR